VELRPQKDVPLAPLTTWRIGGPAEWFLEPESEEQLTDGLRWARLRHLPVHLLGRGSNCLIADEGLRGLVISMRRFGGNRADLSPLDPGNSLLDAAAGLALPRLAKLVAGFGYTGYEFYIGIPGTVGGAVVMNAGFGPADTRQTAARCREVRIVEPDGQAGWHPYAAVHPVYRHTDLVGSGRIVVAARFLLRKKGTPEAIRHETALHLAMRKEKQPLTRPTAGSVFKGTPEGVPAAVYIDRCGLKGLRRGDAMVSHKHANWIENMGKARASEVMELVNRVREEVDKREGIVLEPEVRFLH